MTDACTADGGGAAALALESLRVPTVGTLWTRETVFVPAVLGTVLGDGRALFRITTINDRPRYWIVRGCSSWTCDGDRVPDPDSTDIADHADGIVQAIADEFGGLPNMIADDGDGYEDPSTGLPFDPIDLEFPMIDDRTGVSWGRIDWPDATGLAVVPHPLDPRRTILA